MVLFKVELSAYLMNEKASERKQAPRKRTSAPQAARDEFTLKVSKGLPQCKMDKEIFTVEWKLRPEWEWRYGWVDLISSKTYIFTNKKTGETCFDLQLAGNRGHEFEKVKPGVYQKVKNPIPDSYPPLS